jgi:hypothetical protein
MRDHKNLPHILVPAQSPSCSKSTLSQPASQAQLTQRVSAQGSNKLQKTCRGQSSKKGAFRIAQSQLVVVATGEITKVASVN